MLESQSGRDGAHMFELLELIQRQRLPGQRDNRHQLFHKRARIDKKQADRLGRQMPDRVVEGGVGREGRARFCRAPIDSIEQRLEGGKIVRDKNQ